MPIELTLDNDKERIYSRASGTITFEVLRAHMHRRLEADIAHIPELLDLTEATTEMTESEIRKLADERKAMAGATTGGPTAVVATSDLFFGMFRMFDILTEEVRPMRIFRDKTEAENWLHSIKEDQSAV